MARAKRNQDDSIERIKRLTITYRLEQTFKPEGWVPFDIQFEEKPAEVSDDLAAFWGGYGLEFKLIDTERHERLAGNIVEMRNYAQITGPGQRKRFQVDISRHEHCEPKQAIDVDGYTVYVYAPQLMVCEKLRAICQQMPEYDAVVRRRRARPTARPRDFLDIHTLLTHFDYIDLDGPDTRKLLAQVFAAKRAPLNLLSAIKDTFDQHVTAWRAVQDTVRPGFDLKDFRFYFDYVVSISERLHPGGDM